MEATNVHGLAHAAERVGTPPPAPVAMPLYGRLEPFEGDGSAWPVYQEQVHVFFLANDTPEAKQRDVFLASCGTRPFSLLLDLLKPATPHVKTLGELLATLCSHFSPAPSTLMERFRFNNRSRLDGETLGQFVAALVHSKPGLGGKNQPIKARSLFFAAHGKCFQVSMAHKPAGASSFSFKVSTAYKQASTSSFFLKASSTVTNNEEDGGNQDKGEKTGNELPTPSATGPDTALDVTAIVKAAVQTTDKPVDEHAQKDGKQRLVLLGAENTP
ncbi:hypothetical protein ISCGN_019333 [Ixodes scapularis]